MNTTTSTYGLTSWTDPYFIGWDKVLDRISGINNTNAYPPYNVRKLGEDKYIIDLALAGWVKDELEIKEENGTLTISGEKNESSDEYLYKGIATRKFTRQFSLAEHVKVEDAHMQHGMLNILLVREIPEEKKPKTIEINDFVNKKKLGR